MTPATGGSRPVSGAEMVGTALVLLAFAVAAFGLVRAWVDLEAGWAGDRSGTIEQVTEIMPDGSEWVTLLDEHGRVVWDGPPEGASDVFAEELRLHLNDLWLVYLGGALALGSVGAGLVWMGRRVLSGADSAPGGDQDDNRYQAFS